MSNELLQTSDAQQWAREFIARFGAKLVEIDEGLMLAWFANAIETGRTFGYEKGLREGRRGSNGRGA